MASLNHVVLLGRLGADPEAKIFESGSQVVNMSVATTSYRKDPNNDNEWLSDTTWHKIKAFGNLGERMGTKARKGDIVLVVGKITKHTFTTRAGQEVTSCAVVANQMQVIPRDAPQQPAEKPKPYPAFPEPKDDDIPF